MNDKELLKSILEFFVKAGQEKILTKVNPNITKATDFYTIDNRVNTENNTLGLQNKAWENNIRKYYISKSVIELQFNNTFAF